MKRFLLVNTSIIILILSALNTNGQISFPAQSSFKYLKGSAAAGMPSNWMDPGYNDAAWSTGNAPFWYGDGSGGTQVNDMQYNYLTLYMRSTFNASNIAAIQEVLFSINYDDGFVIWINGDEVLNVNAPSSYAYNDSATANHESGAFEDFILSIFDLNLVEGTNTIAIQGFNVGYASSDFHFDLGISATISTPILPDTVGLSFSHASGYYDNPFTLTITSPDAGANVVYTVDGSNPQDSPTKITAGNSVNIYVDPANTSNRGATPGYVIRASITKAGYQPSYPTGRTFIFFDQLFDQDYPGWNWPAGDVWGVTTPSGYGAQVIDYEMDPDIINDGRYHDKMGDAFLDIPTMSVITDNVNLFDENTGIYVNAAGHGIEWERECTFEMFDPSGAEEGFNVNAGIRIRGGWSRHPDFAKHSFRMFFRAEYGNAKLNYPLFGDEGVDTYDKIDIRTSQNYAWAQGDPANTMVREVFSRDMQGDMGSPYTRSRYYHLFLNGMYWGLFQTQERSEARFASDYFGDSAEDYDVVKVSTENWSYSIEATDGNTDSWRRVYNKVLSGFSDNADYFSLEGKDANGKPLPGSERLVDIDNLIDYMLGIFYTGNFDAPTSSFGGNDGPNNFYAIKNRNDKDKGFVFFNHDAEHALFYYAHSPGIGINENRVDIGTRDGNYQMSIWGFLGFHPQWLHFKLCDNAEYRLRFADRAVMFLSEGAELSPEKCTQRFNARASQIETAIIAESARWGDQRSGYPFNKEDNWDPEINNTINSFFPVRTNLTINQLRNEGLWPDVEAPEIYRNGNLLTEREYTINPGWIISLENPGSAGILYYTLDGTDPRKIGGSLRGSAIEAYDHVVMTLGSSAIITARIYDNGEWSGLRQIRFFSGQDDLSKLKITEIHYHPQDIIMGNDTTSGKNFEFLEFKNTGTGALNLSGVTIDSAVYYEFPEKTILGPGQFYVVISKPSGFFEKYGMIGSGNFKGNLANSGEKILVTGPYGEQLMLFTYDDQYPWPDMADGEGPSMVSVETNPTGDPADPTYWRASYRIDGSPFADDLLFTALDEPAQDQPEQMVVTLFPNPSNGWVNIGVEGLAENELIHVRLIRIDGQLISEMNVPNNQILDLTGQSIDPGIYIMQLEIAGRHYTRKIVYTP